jgi:hypothetical protein
MQHTTAPARLRRSARALPVGIATAVLLAAGTAAAAIAHYDIESLPNGSTYVLFDTVVASDATMELRRFRWSDGTWFGGGEATVVTSNLAGGSTDQELNLNNIMVRVIPDVPAEGATYRYADLGGNVNLGVNGDHRNVEQMITLDGTVVGNCDITVTETAIAGGVRGEVTITPQDGFAIDMFGFGGQEFYIDDVYHDW